MAQFYPQIVQYFKIVMEKRVEPVLKVHYKVKGEVLFLILDSQKHIQDL